MSIVRLIDRLRYLSTPRISGPNVWTPLTITTIGTASGSAVYYPLPTGLQTSSGTGSWVGSGVFSTTTWTSTWGDTNAGQTYTLEYLGSGLG